MLEIKNFVKEMNTGFDDLLSRQDRAEEAISELEDVTIDSKAEKGNKDWKTKNKNKNTNIKGLRDNYKRYNLEQLWLRISPDLCQTPNHRSRKLSENQAENTKNTNAKTKQPTN